MSMFFTSQLENDRQTVETSLFFFNVNYRGLAEGWHRS